MKKFDLEQAYKKYLSMNKLDESRMNSFEKIERKRTFYGGCGVMLKMFLEDVSELSEDEGVDTLNNLFKQVNDFFKTEIEKHEN